MTDDLLSWFLLLNLLWLRNNWLSHLCNLLLFYHWIMMLLPSCYLLAKRGLTIIFSLILDLNIIVLLNKSRIVNFLLLFCVLCLIHQLIKFHIISFLIRSVSHLWTLLLLSCLSNNRRHDLPLNNFHFFLFRRTIYLLLFLMNILKFLLNFQMFLIFDFFNVLFFLFLNFWVRMVIVFIYYHVRLFLVIWVVSLWWLVQ